MTYDEKRKQTIEHAEEIRALARYGIPATATVVEIRRVLADIADKADAICALHYQRRDSK